MKGLKGFIAIICIVLAMLTGIACFEKKTYPTPPGYDLNSPVKDNMSDALAEISGITFHNGKPDMLFAEQDEEGKVFYFKPGSKETPKYSRFAKSGDYEDITILGNQIVVLKSNGTLYIFPFNQVWSEAAANVVEVKDLLPKGEYESMYGDEKAGLLYILCKDCGGDKVRTTAGYKFKLAANGVVTPAGGFSIDTKPIEAQVNKKKFAFRPSAFAKNPGTGEWFIVASINKLLVIADAAFKVKGVYSLNPALFLQPEGLAFDNQHNLYISNEGDEITPGNVLKFTFKK
ncbi:MAG: SdiA-regulated family protein [Bacteroidota bacterium]